jgi:cytochrome b561
MGWHCPGFALDHGRADFAAIGQRSLHGLLGLVTVHAVAAIKHHAIDKDDVLRRMTPI